MCLIAKLSGEVPRVGDDGFQVRTGGIPPELALNLLRGSDERSWIACAARGHLSRNVVAGDLAAHFDDLLDGVPIARTQVVNAVGARFIGLEGCLLYTSDAADE